MSSYTGKPPQEQMGRRLSLLMLLCSCGGSPKEKISRRGKTYTGAGLKKITKKYWPAKNGGWRKDDSN
ncbi:MAG: hypothetical protein PHF35_02985 [Candidatus Moranbacteria bacterium]|nr:hypothetical protein [Candidatus Moranbacteria bacterium]